MSPGYPIPTEIHARPTCRGDMGVHWGGTAGLSGQKGVFSPRRRGGPHIYLRR